MTGTWDTRSVVRLFNGVGALVVFSVVFGAYGIQFIFLEPPCPLCLLIRIGMIATGFGLVLNALFGPRPLHYGFALLGCVFGVIVSLRNIALHIVPGTGSYGDAVFGFHLYTWAFLVFMAMIIAIAVVMFFQRQFDETGEDAPKIVNVVAVIALSVGIFLAAANAFTTAVECELGPCPDNPTRVL
ncbi:MAG: disulfide bond formation protein B [Solirubrobacterales bacterium]|nr:disulfide bond formation protein B [Solirubrobacterales bacterium]